MSHFLANVFLRGLSTEGNLRFKIDWASHIVGSKFTIFAVLLYIWGQFSKYKLPGAYSWRGDLTEGFFFLGGGAYIWRGLFSEFYGILPHSLIKQLVITVL